MERLWVCVACLLLVLLLVVGGSGCSVGERVPDYRESPFRATVSWVEMGLLVEAEIEANREGEVRIELLSPSALAGFVLLAEGERRVIRCGDVELNGDAMGHLFEIALLLLPVGERQIVCETEWEGQKVIYGEIGGESTVELYLDPRNGIPVCIRSGERTLAVHAFEVLEEDT